MGEAGRVVRCGTCDKVLDEHGSSECPACGSIARRWELLIESEITVHSSLDTKAKDSSGKWFQKQRVGDSFYRLTGQWHRLRRLIDKRANRYVEHIEDEAGDTVRHVDEPLTEHTGRGSARPERQGEDESSTSAE